MSNINTGSIDVSYPVAGVNNDSQGFRTNFTSIKNNLDTAGSEITDIQNKGIFKSALVGTVLNNDMNNALISNALVSGFRSTTNNLGNNLSGTVTVDVTAGDVQYGTMTGNIALGFAKWAPAGTQANVQVILSVPSVNANSILTLPSSVDSSKTTLENYSNNAITVANGVTEIHLMFSTEDCGTTLTVTPMNRPRKSTQVQTSTAPANIGRVGDRAGTMTSDANYLYVCTADYNGTTAIWKRVALTAY
jgi:hypothetical protein